MIRTLARTSAQYNPTPGNCWGVLSRIFGYCLKKAVPGKLTCLWHAPCEHEAQKLKQKLAAQGTEQP
jgi:hypothetical protein